MNERCCMKHIFALTRNASRTWATVELWRSWLLMPVGGEADHSSVQLMETLIARIIVDANECTISVSPRSKQILVWRSHCERVGAKAEGPPAENSHRRRALWFRRETATETEGRNPDAGSKPPWPRKLERNPNSVFLGDKSSVAVGVACRLSRPH